MARKPDVVIDAVVCLANEKAMRALEIVADTLVDLHEDFEYRADVKRAMKAARYLMRNLEVVTHEDDVEQRLDAAMRDKQQRENGGDDAVGA